MLLTAINKLLQKKSMSTVKFFFITNIQIYLSDISIECIISEGEKHEIFY